MGADLAPEKISGLSENGMNLYDHNQLTEIHKKIKNMIIHNYASIDK